MKSKILKISIIAAVAENGVIGKRGDIPWYLPSDFAFFKSVTIGKPIIMGRKTFDSIGRPLPKRTNIIVSKQKDYQPDGVIVIDSLEGAIEKAIKIAKADKIDEIMIIGGANIYQQAIGLADRLYISHVALSPEGDSLFPKINPKEFRLLDQLKVKKSEKDSAQYKVNVYQRINA